MRDEMTDIEWLLRQIERAELHARSLSGDIKSQDGLRLTGTVMRLDRVRDALEEAWRTLQLIYATAHDRDRTLSADRTVGEPSNGSAGVVADVLRAAAAGIRQAGSDLHHGSGGSADVAV